MLIIITAEKAKVVKEEEIQSGLEKEVSTKSDECSALESDIVLLLTKSPPASAAEVAAKRKQLTEANVALKNLRVRLTSASSSLSIKIESLAKHEDNFNYAVSIKERLAHEMTMCALRLESAKRLIRGDDDHYQQMAEMVDLKQILAAKDAALATKNADIKELQRTNERLNMQIEILSRVARVETIAQYAEEAERVESIGVLKQEKTHFGVMLDIHSVGDLKMEEALRLRDAHIVAQQTELDDAIDDYHASRISARKDAKKLQMALKDVENERKHNQQTVNAMAKSMEIMKLGFEEALRGKDAEIQILSDNNQHELEEALKTCITTEVDEIHLVSATDLGAFVIKKMSSKTLDKLWKNLDVDECGEIDRTQVLNILLWMSVLYVAFRFRRRHRNGSPEINKRKLKVQFVPVKDWILENKMSTDSSRVTRAEFRKTFGAWLKEYGELHHLTETLERTLVMGTTKSKKEMYLTDHDDAHDDDELITGEVKVGSHKGKCPKIVKLQLPGLFVSPIPVNKQHRGWTDSFRVEVDGYELKVFRTDKPDFGWCQNLRLAYTNQKNPLISSSGGSYAGKIDEKDITGKIRVGSCEGKGPKIKPLPSTGLFVSPIPMNRMGRTSKGQTFRVEVDGDQLKVFRTDEPDQGWKQGLLLAYTDKKPTE